MESLAYMLIYLCIDGGLPWSFADDEELVGALKEAIDPMNLVKNIPHYFGSLLKYAR